MDFNFATNIVLRVPATGEACCIDRMTSDYAQAHPFDLGGFVENVYQKFAGTEFEENREELLRVWVSVLSATNPRGDSSLYPNKDGRRRAAAMEVWHKACDYWRRGLRIGDILPYMVPMTTITRMDDDSWIALFPKDEHLLHQEGDTAGSDAAPASESTPEQNPELAACRQSERPVIAPVQNQEEPLQLDLFAAQEPRPRLQRMSRTPTAECQTSDASHQPSHLLPAIGIAAAVVVLLAAIWQTGLLIPIGLIGLATGNLLK